MAKLLSFLIVFSFLSINSVFAQKQMTGSGVILSGAATVACSLKVELPANTVSIQAVIAKTSGTLAGTLTVQGSIDGVNYETVNASLVLPTPATYTVTDVASQAKIFVITGSPYLYYRLSWTGSGTMIGTLNGYILPRNYFK
jgi:hypothetical protein